MKHLFYIVGLLALSNCGSEKEEKQDQPIEPTILQDSLTTESLGSEKIDSISKENLPESNSVDYNSLLQNPLHYFPEEINQLKDYFEDSLIVALDSNQFQLNDAKTDTSFLNAYENLLSIRRVLLEQIWEKNLPGERGDDYYPDYIIKDLKEVDDASLGLISTCVAECSEFDFIFFLSDFVNHAKKTRGELDDELFALLLIADEDYGGTGEGWMSWFMRTWDYGGESLMGSGIHLKFLQKAALFQEKTNQFDFLISQYKMGLLQDIKHGIYTHSRENIISELQEILNLSSLTSTEKEPLSKFLTVLESGEVNCENCVDGIFQFNCATEDCNWGG